MMTQKVPSKSKYVVSMLLRPCGPALCEAEGHYQDEHDAFWEGRFYEDMEKAHGLMRQGFSRKRIVSQVWSDLCREQDKGIIHCHRRLKLCFEAVDEMLTAQVNAAAAQIAIKTTVAASVLSGRLGIILCLADRKTQQPFIALYPDNLDDQGLLPFLNRKDLETELFVK